MSPKFFLKKMRKNEQINQKIKKQKKLNCQKKRKNERNKSKE